MHKNLRLITVLGTLLWSSSGCVGKHPLSSYCSCSAAGICAVAFDGLLADDSSILNKAGVASATQGSFTDSVADNVPVWDRYLHLENLLFQNSPSEVDLQAAITGLQDLYQQLTEALPPHSSDRRLNKAAPPAQRVIQADEEEDSTEQSKTAALSAQADAAFMLAVLAGTGIASAHVPLNDSWAVEALHAAAQGGSAQANLALAHRYFMADGVPGSCQEGLRRARLVADEYVVDSEGGMSPELPLEPVSLRLRNMHGSPDSFASQETWAQAQLETDMLEFGDVFERMLGYRQLDGLDMEGDAAGALQQLQEAAALGDPYATFNLGYMHMRGMGTPPNATAARANFEVAARHGIAPAYNGLGVLQYEGHAGAAVDYVAARQAFETGAAFGDPDAMFNLATMHAGGHGVATNHTLAYEHYLDAHDAGHWRAPHSLAMTHQLGWGVQPNCSKAQQYIQTFIKERSSWSDQMDEALLALDAGSEWLALLQYAVVAVQGSAVAQANLAWLLQHSPAYDMQYKAKVCMRLLTQAGKGGLADAWVDAGSMEYKGDQLEEAGRLYGLAAQGGSIEGMYSLGWMHAMGKGVPQNTSHAAALYRQAIEQAPDWQHAAPPFTALVLLPSLLLWQTLHSVLPAATGLHVQGWQKVLEQSLVQTTKRISWDTWVLTAAAASLSWVLWRRHKRFLQTQHTSHTQANSETGVG